MYSATSREFDHTIWKSRYGFRLTPHKPVTLDAIRIINGQNASPARFKANHRANTIKITLSNGKPRHIYLFQFADSQGGKP